MGLRKRLMTNTPSKSHLYMKRPGATYEWYTPTHIVDRVIATLGHIDLDPCSNKLKSIPAGRHFTKKDDGLKREWAGKVYMNPPWGDALRLWAAKLVTEVQAGRVTEAISLTPAQSINRKWFNQFMVGQVQVFVTGAVKFWNSKTDDKNPGWPLPVMIQYFGPNPARFIEHFKGLGIMVQRVNLAAEVGLCATEQPTVDAADEAVVLKAA